MHIIVVGCGRVGSSVARQLDASEHHVVVIDRRDDAFRRLGAAFKGRTLTGVGFDRDVLTSAGITADSAVAAVTSGDNSNILIARVARETFGVTRVVARIYDPKRAAVYGRLGIPTVATVAWTGTQILRHVLPERADSDWIDPTSTFEIVSRRVKPAAAGIPLSDLEGRGVRVAVLTRAGRSLLPQPGHLLQEDDVVHIVVPVGHTHDLDAVLSGSAHTTSGGH